VPSLKLTLAEDHTLYTHSQLLELRRKMLKYARLLPRNPASGTKPLGAGDFFGLSEQFGAVVRAAKLQICCITARRPWHFIGDKEFCALAVSGVAECQCFKASRIAACLENII
jgi:hypothetical protein